MIKDEGHSYYPTGSFLSPLFSNPSKNYQSCDSHSFLSIVHYQNGSYFTYSLIMTGPIHTNSDL